MAGEYAPQSIHDKHDPEGYIDMHNDQEAVAVSNIVYKMTPTPTVFKQVAWMVMGRRVSPRAVFSNIDTLADTILPMFGSHDSDMTVCVHLLLRYLGLMIPHRPMDQV
jgi:hypothetical protein